MIKLSLTKNSLLKIVNIMRENDDLQKRNSIAKNYSRVLKKDFVSPAFSISKSIENNYKEAGEKLDKFADIIDELEKRIENISKENNTKASNNKLKNLAVIINNWRYMPNGKLEIVDELIRELSNIENPKNYTSLLPFLLRLKG